MSSRVRPAGFVLAFLLFLMLPVVSVSCDKPDNGPSGPGSIDVTYTGARLVTASPDIHATGAFSPAPAAAEYLHRVAALSTTAHVLAIGTAFVLLAGIVTSVRNPRPAGEVFLAVLAGLLLITTTIVARADLVGGVRSMLTWLVYLTEAEGADLPTRAGDVVSAGPGCWFPLAVLVATTAHGVHRIIADRGDDADTDRPGG